jgi:alkanesulfonate monooxygenase SsuD/methylene tetrahydromethanopterin reductase-like flavin-dependent oxidoreductase (luciferase family)
MAARGRSSSRFPLFGYDLDDYDDLFSEKLELLLALRESERVTWSGELRAPINNSGVYPRPAAGAIADLDRRWRDAAVVARAGTLGLPWRSRSSAVTGELRAVGRLYRETCASGGT